MLVEEELGAKADGELELAATLVADEVVDPKVALLLPVPVSLSPEEVVFDPPQVVELESPEVVDELAASPPKAAATRASPISLRASASLPEPEGTVVEASPANAMSGRREGSEPRRLSPPRIASRRGVSSQRTSGGDVGHRFSRSTSL